MRSGAIRTHARRATRSATRSRMRAPPAQRQRRPRPDAARGRRSRSTQPSFPHSQANRGVEAISVAFVAKSGCTDDLAISSAAHSPGYDPAEDDRGALTLEPSSGATTDPSVPGVVAFTTLTAARDPLVPLPGRRRQPGTCGHRRGWRCAAPPGHPASWTATSGAHPDAGGRLIFDDDALAAAVADVWSISVAATSWRARRRPNPFWAPFSRGRDARFAQPGAVSAAAWPPGGRPGTVGLCAAGVRRRTSAAAASCATAAR